MARRDQIAVGIRLLTRNGHDLASRYPRIVEAVNTLKVRSCLIDGEAVACDDNGVAVFERVSCAIVQARSTAEYGTAPPTMFAGAASIDLRQRLSPTLSARGDRLHCLGMSDSNWRIRPRAT